MKGLFIFFWVMILIIGWIISSTTIINGENIARTFKIKTIFFWLSVALSVFGSYYLFS
jgi:hypothetical protein